jgi:hypothetical protein
MLVFLGWHYGAARAFSILTIYLYFHILLLFWFSGEGISTPRSPREKAVMLTESITAASC